MKIVVASSLQASSQFANAINTIKMAHGFSRLGHEVTIVCIAPKGNHLSHHELNQLYQLDGAINWLLLPHYFSHNQWLFSWYAYSRLKALTVDFVYARSYLIPYLTSHGGLPTAGETHAHIGNTKFPFQIFLRATKHQMFKLVVTISTRLADHYIARGAPAHKLAVLEDAVDLKLFQPPVQLPPSPFSTPAPNVVYAGHLYDYKGIPTILETAGKMPHINFHFVGGWPEDIKRHQQYVYQHNLTNVTFYGLIPHATVPPYLWYADILLLPPSLHHPSAYWTSPVKLGEYLASGKPVIATAIPALKDWLTDQQVYFVEPDSSEAMAKGIAELLNNPALALSLAQNGRERSQKMSYEERANTILAHSLR